MQIECATDREAINIAGQQTGDYETIEIWDGPRPVGRYGNPDRTGPDQTRNRQLPSAACDRSHRGAIDRGLPSIVTARFFCLG
jgi:hypothetical protein